MSENAQIGVLSARLEADLGTWSRDLNKARMDLDNTSARMNRAMGGIEAGFKKVGGFIGAYLGVKGAMAFKALTVGALDNAVALDKDARAAGMTADKFQELRAAHVAAGGTQESFSDGLRDFIALIGKAAQGSDDAQKALARVGITEKDLLSMSTDELFVKASNGLALMADAGGKAAEAQELFGRSAKENIVPFSQSAAQIERMGKAAHDAGQIMSGESIEAAKKNRIEYQRLAEVLENQVNSAFIQWAPLLVKTTELLGNIGRMAIDAAYHIGLLTPATAEEQYQVLLEKRVMLEDKIADLQRGTFQFPWVKSQIADARVELTKLDEALERMRQDQKKLGVTQGAKIPAASKITDSSSTKAFRSLLEEMRKQEAEVDAEMTQDAAAQAQKRQEIAEREMHNKIAAASVSVDQRKQLEDEYSKWVVAKTKETNYKLRTPMEQLVEQWRNTTKQMQDAQANWAQQGLDTLVDFVTTGKADFHAFAQAIIRDLTKIYLEKMLVGSMTDSGGSSGVGGIIGGIMSMFRANGGPVSGGQSYIVGEREPEVFTPSTAGYITPVSRMGASGGGGGLTVYIDATGADAAGLARVERAVQDLHQNFERRAVSAVGDANRRGGTFGKQFRSAS